ncbi:MAG: YggS family pyridoxal phosphate-dependent enzyme [Chitinophagales bacterium]
MIANEGTYKRIKEEIKSSAGLVAVSKTKSIEEIRSLYELGQRDFGENYVQELIEKQKSLPKDIRWHFIGHLQSNKVKFIAPFIHLIQSVDSFKLLNEIEKQARKSDLRIDCLLQVHIAKEETKFGLNEDELDDCLQKSREGSMTHVTIRGLMGMATLTGDSNQVRAEFKRLKFLFDKYSGDFIKGGHEAILSMGMSSDYRIAIEEGSTMVRIGTLLFGERPSKV